MGLYLVVSLLRYAQDHISSEVSRFGTQPSHLYRGDPALPSPGETFCFIGIVSNQAKPSQTPHF
jgi:hypothetical protein